MPILDNCNDTILWHIAEITSRIIAESGKPSDRFHLGKIIRQCLEDNPDNEAQIEGSTGASETNGRLLKRSIQCAIALKKLGFKHGDVMTLMAPNHLDLAVPFYAALFLGIIISPIDRFLSVNRDIKYTFRDQLQTTMPILDNCNDTILWHIAEITSRIIAESGKPSDRFHLGKIIRQCLEDNPDNEAQIEGSTGASETNGRLLKRSIQCAIALKKLGFKHGDVMTLMAPNHLDLAVPFYAALFLGIIISPIDRFLSVKELIDSFTVNKPKIMFAQSEKEEDIQKALKEVDLETKIVTFDKGGVTDFLDLMKIGEDPKEIENFRVLDFDPAETIAMLIPTSGTTGLPKSAVVTHKNMSVMAPYIWSKTNQIPAYKRVLIVSPLQWLSAIIMYHFGPLLQLSRLQSVEPATTEHSYELINKYRPNVMVISPTMMKTLMNPESRGSCDFTSFKQFFIGGSAFYEDLFDDLREVCPEAKVCNTYGLSEITSAAFLHQFSSPPQSCGKPHGGLEYRLVDESGRDIEEPNVNGELWLKGPGVFKGYYNNTKATEEVFEGAWFKTGDIFYRDENWNYYFVERIKLLLKYMNHQISPVELEAVIRQHGGVLDVAVAGVPDAARGDLPVACVVPVPGRPPTAQEIKDLVRETLTDTKQLRGGVVFLKELPLTPSAKVNRKKLREMVLNLKRE